MPEQRNQSGMTLVEILVGMVMMGIIVTGIYNLFRVHNLMAAKQEETTRMQQELLSALVDISDELRMCGYTPLNSTQNFGMKVSANNARETNATSVYCTRGGAFNHIAYRSGNNEIYFYNSTDEWDVIASNISDLRFAYFDVNGDEITAPTNATIEQIRMIEINATAIPTPQRSSLGIRSRNMNTRVWLRNLNF
jgi:prepilin-type N-terminal cleavage/methylation domain-containing protein